MSLLAGFDFVTEISQETILKLIKNNLQIGGMPATPPFEVMLPFSAGTATGTAHLIITDLQLDLVADKMAHLILSFDTGSVMVTAPLALTVYPLDGNITVDMALALVAVAGQPGQLQLSPDLPNATCTVNFSAQASTAIATALAGKPVTPAAFKTAATQAITQFVHGVAPPSLPLKFTVVPGMDGTLQPSLVFEQLEVHCIPNPSRSMQALGLFGILLKANHGHGDHTLKTATAITAAHDGVCVSISPQAFRALVFCPGVASALGTTVAKLPTSCGSAGRLDAQGVTLTSVVDSFGNQQIDINGTATKSGPCYDASASFHGTIQLSLSGSTLTPHVNVDDPIVDISIPWYCILAAPFVLGPLGIAITSSITLIGPAIAGSLLGDALRNALGSGLPGIGTGGLTFFTVTGVSITTEGLTIQGTVPLSVATSQFSRRLTLTGSVTTSSSVKIDSGIFHTKVWCMPEAKDYPYDEYTQQQEGTYTLSGTMVPLPLTPVLTLNATGVPAVSLSGSSGTVQIPNVDCYFPAPLGSGGAKVNQTVHIDYTISGGTVHLKNRVAEGNYAVWLTAQAKDASGQPVKDGSSELQTFEFVQFEGHHMEIGGGYAADVQTCAALLAQWVQRISSDYKIYQKVPIWVEVNYPAPDELVAYIRDLVALGIPEVDNVLGTIKAVHGNSFNRAIFSPAASQGVAKKIGGKVGEVAHTG
jgi:hypothetical protein